MKTKFKLLLIAVIVAVFSCSAAFALQTYTVTNLNDSGTGSLADCFASAEADDEPSRIVFDVNGTITRTSGRFTVNEPNLTICGTDAPGDGITLDFNANSSGFRVLAHNVRFCNLKIQNTATNSDGIGLRGSNCVIERCSFEYCRDEGIGVTQYGGYTARGNVIAYCRVENCGSQADPYPDGRGILVTENASATIVGTYVDHCCRGITVNYVDGFADIRNCFVNDSLSPASGSGITIVGTNGPKANVIDCNSSNNANSGHRFKTSCEFYRDNLTGYGNTYDLVSIDVGCTESETILTESDTPFPSWLSDANTPTQASDVGMGTGDCQCDVADPNASNPNPADNATAVDPNADLSWTAGPDANSHDVYFGTSSSGVADANHASSEYKGNQTLDANSYEPGTMSGGTTYYWAIDEVNDSNTWAGEVWSFTVAVQPPSQATSPSPSNSATGVSTTADLSWTAGAGATSHDVYFGTSSPGAFQGNQAGTTFDTGTMAGSTVYYWRIDEKNDGGTTTGTVWSFTTQATAPGQASNPSPANSATGVSTTADLSWTAGSGADDHDVYFGTSSPGTFQGNQVGLTFDTGTMGFETTYFWRIDANNSSGTTTGTVWSFTTGPNVPVADYYVDPNGDDEDDGTTLGTAFATIDHAVDVVAAGDTVLVMPGTYNEYVNMNSVGGTSGSPITFKGYTDGGDVIIDATDKTHGIRCAEVYVTWEGFIIKNSNNNGILLDGGVASNGKIKNCVIYDHWDHGIKISGADNCEVDNCLIFGQRLDGIENVSSAENTVYTNCTIYDNDDDGFHIGGSDVTITDCIIAENGEWGVDTVNACVVGVNYCDTYGNTSGTYDNLDKITVDENSITSDPNFVDAANGDFHLNSGSPCEGTASDSGDMGYRYD